MTTLRVLAGDELGYVRVCANAPAASDDDGESLHLIGKFGALDRASATLRMHHATPNAYGDDSLTFASLGTIVAARKGGRVDALDARSGAQKHKTLRVDGEIVDAYGSCSSATAMDVIVVHASGEVSTHGVEGDGDWTRRGSFTAMANALSADVDTRLGRIVIGGKDFGNDVMIYDIAEGKRLYKAKPPPVNWLNYRAPPWVSATCFASQSECVRFFVGTGEHRFRHYDTREAKRAVLELDMGNAVITSVASSADGNEAYVANARGLFEIVDLRAGRTRGKFRGNSGSIRQIAVHPDGMHVACGGLDQYVRVYDVKTKRAVASAYAKQALTSIVFDAYTPEVEAANAKSANKKAKKSTKVEADGSVKKLKKKVKRVVASDSEDDVPKKTKKTKKKLKMRIE